MFEMTENKISKYGQNHVIHHIYVKMKPLILTPTYYKIEKNKWSYKIALNFYIFYNFKINKFVYVNKFVDNAVTLIVDYYNAIKWFFVPNIC